MNETPRKAGEELLRDLSEKLAVMAKEMLGVNLSQAQEFAEEVAARVADDWGGQNIYVPKDLASRLGSRNARIYKDFTGDNVPELVSKYGLSAQHVYRIIKRERARRMMKQHSLFEG